MKSFSTMKKYIAAKLGNVCLLIIALMLSFGLGTAQAKDRISYFHSDISGSPIAATNDSGEVLWEETYKPYGERLDNTPSDNKNQNNNWFTGKQEEADLGLQYFGARWYHQASGRFISRDPAAVMDHVESNPMMFNRYAYANNNPYKYVDPDGRVVWFIPLVLFIAKEVASEGIEQVTGLPMPTAKNGLKYAIKQANKQIAKEGMKQAAKVVKATSKKTNKKVNGNSKQSTKDQHGYEIVDTKTNTVCKTGVSGCGLNKNGTSPRANSQANKWNKEQGNEGRYQPRVVKKIPGGTGSRQEILKWEQRNAAKLRRELDPARHSRP